MSNLIPKAQNEETKAGKKDLKNGICILSNAFDDDILTVFAERISSKGITILNDSTNETAARISILKKEVVSNCSKDTYKLIIDKDGIEVNANDRAGAINALTSLYQLIDTDSNLPFIEISDDARYPYRGIHIDPARHFFSVDTIKKIIEEVSLVKINKLHLHLSDDQGFRIYIDKYPQLAKQCGKQYYSKSDIEDIVEFARLRGIEIIPEIDMPGHTRAIIAAYPELSCKGETVELATCGGIYPAILCPGKEETFQFIEKILDEIIPLFPGEYFHIGGDEAPKHNWKTCPACQKRIKEEGLKDETNLKGYFSKRVSDYIIGKYGKKIICWNDSLEFVNHLNGAETIQYWSLEHRKQLPDFIEKGGHFIYSDMFDLYYDYPAAMSPMKRSYLSKPVISEVDYTNNTSMIGFECCNWSEYTFDGKSLEQKIFPRIYAMAENAWSEVSEKDYADFKRRLKLYKKNISNVIWGSADPGGMKKQIEKVSYAITMSMGMPKDVKEQTVEAARMSEEFMKLFKTKMLKN